MVVAGSIPAGGFRLISLSSKQDFEVLLGRDDININRLKNLSIAGWSNGNLSGSYPEDLGSNPSHRNFLDLSPKTRDLRERGLALDSGRVTISVCKNAALAW